MASLPLFPSCRVPVVVIQHAVQPLAPADNPCVFRDTLDWNDEPISEPLMVPLGVIMCDEIVGRIPQRIFTKEDHSLQAAFLDSANEPFGVCVSAAIHTHHRQQMGVTGSAPAFPSFNPASPQPGQRHRRESGLSRQLPESDK